MKITIKGDDVVISMPLSEAAVIVSNVVDIKKKLDRAIDDDSAKAEAKAAERTIARSSGPPLQRFASMMRGLK